MPGIYLTGRRKSRGPGVSLSVIGNASPAIAAGGPGSGRHPYGKLKAPLSVEQAKELVHPTWYRHFNWKKQAYGGILVDSQGRFLLREPAGHFDGYVWTFPKGKMDSEHEHPVDVANREVNQETGYKAGVIGQLPYTYTSSSGSFSNFYLMRPTAWNQKEMDTETQHLKWATYEEAKKLIGQTYNDSGRQRDLSVLEVAHNYLKKGKLSAGAEWNEDLHPRGDHGKFAPNPSSGIVDKSAVVKGLQKMGWHKLPTGPLPGLFKGEVIKSPKTLLSHPQHGTIGLGKELFYHIPKDPNQPHVSGNYQTELAPHVNQLAKALSPQEVQQALDKLGISKPDPLGYAAIHEKHPEIFGDPAATLKQVANDAVKETVTKMSPPAGMANVYHDVDSLSQFIFNPATGNYHIANSEGKPSKTEGIKPETVKTTPNFAPGAKPAATVSEILNPETKAPEGRPEGMPTAVKGPKGGVYVWNKDSQTYKHGSGKYELTKEQVKGYLQKGSYTPHDPSAPKAATGSKVASSTIPSGMYSEYVKKPTFGGKGTAWHYKFDEATGNYKMWKGNYAPSKAYAITPGQMLGKANAWGAVQPTKGAVAGSGPSIQPENHSTGYSPGSQSPAVSSPPPAPIAQFTYKNAGFDPSNGEKLKGAHEKHIFTDKNGTSWMFKPATTLSGQPSPLMAHADEMASKIQQALRPGTAVEAKAITLDVPGKGQTFGSVQKMIPGVSPNKDFSTRPVTSLTPSEVKGLQQEQVVDWLISNHDSHGGQFLRTDSTGGTNVIGIDKTQAFKYFPGDKLSTDYHPNATYGEAPPYYNKMWEAAKAGQLPFNPQDAFATIKNAKAMSDAKYKQMLQPYADARFGSDTANKEQFLNQAVGRKNSLQSDFEKFYSGILGKDFKFDTGAHYPANPAPEKVSQEAHEALIDQGYSFQKLGAKTGFPLYVDKGGKAVYVTSPIKNSYEYYPMGPHGSNPYGSSKGEGIEPLKSKLEEPFEKPETPQTTYSYKQPQNLSPELQAKYDALPEVPYTHNSSGSSTAAVTKKTPLTPSEKSVLDSYKGSGYIGINSFLYNGGAAEEDYKVKNLDSALTKSYVNKDITVWRGTGAAYANQLKEWFLQGNDVHAPKSFQSTATDQGFAHSWGGGDVKFQIHVKAGTPAYAWGSEHEIMLSRHVVYKVNKLFKSGGKLYADVDAVYNPPSKEVKSSMARKRKVDALIRSIKPLSVREFVARHRQQIDPDLQELAMCEVYNSKTGKKQTGADVLKKQQ